MCLAVPAKIESMDKHRATVALEGSRTDVLLALVPEAEVGDWVLVHAGYAISVLSEAEAQETCALLSGGRP